MDTTVQFFLIAFLEAKVRGVAGMAGRGGVEWMCTQAKGTGCTAVQINTPVGIQVLC